MAGTQQVSVEELAGCFLLSGEVTCPVHILMEVSNVRYPDNHSHFIHFITLCDSITIVTIS